MIVRSIFLLLRLVRLGMPLLAALVGGCWASSMSRADDWFLISCHPSASDNANRIWTATGVRCISGRLVVMRHQERYDAPEMLGRAIIGRSFTHDLRLLMPPRFPPGPSGQRVVALGGTGYFRQDDKRTVQVLSPDGTSTPLPAKSTTQYLTTDSFNVPLWLTILGLLIPNGRSGMRLLRQAWRRRQGRCAGCGFDLRHSVDRCPECGLRFDSSPDNVTAQTTWLRWLYAAAVGLTACIAAGVTLRAQTHFEPFLSDFIDAPPLWPTPANLYATLLADQRVRLQWEPRGGERGHHTIEESISPKDSLRMEIGSNPFDWTPRLDNRSVRFRFVDNVHLGPAATIQLPLNPPPPPNLTRLTPNMVELHWDDLTDDEDGFEIERAEGDEAFRPLTTITGGNASVNYRDQTVHEATGYLYRVRRVSGDTRSPFCPAVAIITAPASLADPNNPPIHHLRIKPLPTARPPAPAALHLPPGYADRHADVDVPGDEYADQNAGWRQLWPIAATFIAVAGIALFASRRWHRAKSCVWPALAGAAAVTAAAFVSVPRPAVMPRDIQLTGVNGHAVLSWQPPRHGWPQMCIESADDGSDDWQTRAQLLPGQARALLFEPDDPGPVRYRLVATNPTGSAAPSIPVSVAVPLSRPSEPIAQAEQDAVYVEFAGIPKESVARVEQWDGADGFRAVGVVQAPKDHLVDQQPLLTGNRFIYRIRFERPGRPASDWAWAAASTDLTPYPPLAPKDLRSEFTSDDDGKRVVRIAWRPMLGVTWFHLDRCDGPDQRPAVRHLVPGDQQEFIDRDVVPGQTYRYSISAFNRAGGTGSGGGVTILVDKQ